MNEDRTYLHSYLNYEIVRELYGEGQIFYFYKRNYSSIMTVFDPVTEVVRASEKLYVLPLPDTEADNRQ